MAGSGHPQWKGGNREATRRFRRYGLDLDGYQSLLASQHNLCAICRLAFGAWIPSIDHVHGAAMRVRGLLCGNCNVLLGHAKDNPALLRAAAAYLETTIGPELVSAKVRLLPGDEMP